MKKRILYSILNEWRDEDIEDFPLDLDDMDFEVTSSDMDNEPDLDDDEFTLSEIHSQYEYFPETRLEFKEIVKMEIEKQGGVHVNLNMINTSKITDMSFICSFCESLETLDISKWDVSSVENMGSMFCFCESLKTLDISGWNVSGVRNMEHMFQGCKLLKTLDVSGWNVSGVRNMAYMFSYCESLHTDTTMWNIKTKSNTTNMYLNAPYIKRNKHEKENII